jgi:RNA polymerase sigma factor (TIGR02999 family)
VYHRRAGAEPRRPPARLTPGAVDRTIEELIASTDRGDPAAAEALFAALYRELHQLARRELARGGGQLSLGATTLLHEAYLDMSGRAGTTFPDRPRFMGYAARVMRSLIVDHARGRRALKRGGAFEITALDTGLDVAAPPVAELDALSAALDDLAAVDPRLALVVDLKFFCGFSFVEIAAMQGQAERTVQRDWDKARTFLLGALRRDAVGG